MTPFMEKIIQYNLKHGTPMPDWAKPYVNEYKKAQEPKVQPITPVYEPKLYGVKPIVNLTDMSPLVSRATQGFMFAPIPASYATALMPEFVKAIYKPTPAMVSSLHNVFKNTAMGNLLHSTLGENVLSKAMSSYFNMAFNRLGTGINILGNLGRTYESYNPVPYLSFLKYLIG